MWFFSKKEPSGSDFGTEWAGRNLTTPNPFEVPAEKHYEYLSLRFSDGGCMEYNTHDESITKLVGSHFFIITQTDGSITTVDTRLVPIVTSRLKKEDS